MNVKDIEDLAAEKYLQSGEVDARISVLEDLSREDFEDEESWNEVQDELAELQEFRGDVVGWAGPARWNNGMTLVADSAWDEFAEDEAESLFGRTAVDSGYFQLDRFALDLQSQDYQDAELRGCTFWYRS
jgi:hypothetical protein